MDRWLIGFIVGVLSSPWLKPAWSLWLLPSISLALCLLVVVLDWLVRLRKHANASPINCTMHSQKTWSQPLWQYTCVLVTMGVLCGMQWSLINAQGSLSWKIAESERRQTLSLQIRILSIVDDNYARLRFDARVIPSPSSPIQQPIKLRLYWYGTPEELPQLGETWLVSTQLRPVAGLQNQTGFNSQAFLRRHQIQATGSIQAGVRLQQTSWQRQPLQYVRQFIFTQLGEHRAWLPNADVLLALSIGQRHWLDTPRWQVLQRTGVAHLMAISGLHLSMVFGAGLLGWIWLLSGVRRAVGYLGVRWQQFNTLPAALVLAWLGALFYAALADFAVATIRALLLISFFLVLRYAGAQSSAFRVLGFAVAGIFLVDPIAFLDPGFWLSCVAVMAIFVWLWRLPRARFKQPSETAGALVKASRGMWFRVAQLWRFEVMLTLLLLPLTVVFFAGVPWVAPLTNLLTVPVFSALVMPLTLLALPLLAVAPGIAYSMLAVADQVVSWVWTGLLWVTEIGFLEVTNKPLGWIILSMVCAHYAPFSAGLRRQWGFGLSTSALLLWLVQPRLQASDPRVWLHVLDVGQGSAAVIERQGEALLFDTGPGYQGVHQGANIIRPFLRQRGLRPVMLVLSHGHADHIGGADYLIANYPQMVVVDTEARGLSCAWGRAWEWQGVHVHFLAPMTKVASHGVNNHSCVMQLRFADQAVLLPGDVERLGEFRLARHYENRLRSNVLLVAHHGSRTSSHRYVLERVRPEWAIISSGYLNRFNMPHPETLTRLGETNAQIFNTATAGQVSLVWYRQRWQIRTQRDNFGAYWFNQLE